MSLFENILKNLGVEKFSPKARQETMEAAAQLLFNRIMADGLRQLGTKEKNELKKILDKGEIEPQVIVDFFNNRLANFNKIVSEQLAWFDKEMSVWQEKI